MENTLKIVLFLLPFLAKAEFLGDDTYTREEIVFYAQKGPGSSERIARKGVLTKRVNAQATIVILHGIELDKFDVGPLRLLLRKYNVLTFDFRAHGENKGEQQSTIGHDEVYDVFGVVDYIKARADIKNLPIIGYGLSMGAATAIEAQALDPSLFTAMFLDTPFATSDAFIEKIADKLEFTIFGKKFDFLSNIAKKYAFTNVGQFLIKLFLRLFLGHGLKVDVFVKPIFPIESIKKISIPIFLVVCKNDETFSYQEVVKLYNAHNGITRLLLTGGRQHCDSLFYIPEYYKSVLNKFIRDVVSGDIYKQPKKQVEEVLVDKEDKLEIVDDIVVLEEKSEE